MRCVKCDLEACGKLVDITKTAIVSIDIDFDSGFGRQGEFCSIECFIKFMDILKSELEENLKSRNKHDRK